MKDWFQRGLCLVITMVILFACGGSFAEGSSSSFDLDVFRNQITIVRNPPNSETDCQYVIRIDDMEAQGIISLNGGGGGYPTDDSENTYHYMDSDRWLYTCEPDVILWKYGTTSFVPFPRIWFYYYGADLYTYETAIFKIGDTTYTFDNISVSYDTSNWSDECRFESKMVCICDATYTDFMDAWIANEDSIKVRLKGSKNTVDFNYPSKQQAYARLMFQNFRDAGGYDLLPTIKLAN